MTPEKYYLIERNGEMVGVPEGKMTEGELAETKYNELIKMGQAHFAHAKELKGYSEHAREVERLKDILDKRAEE